MKKKASNATPPLWRKNGGIRITVAKTQCHITRVETPFRTWKQAAEIVGVVTELEGWYWPGGRGVQYYGKRKRWHLFNCRIRWDSLPK